MDELTPTQIKTLRADLVALKARLEATQASNDISAQTVELDSSIGRLSRMDALQQQKMAEATALRQGARLRNAERAIVRISAGDYGFCTECDDPIAFPRLKASPETPLCLRCQSARESRA